MKPAQLFAAFLLFLGLLAWFVIFKVLDSGPQTAGPATAESRLPRTEKEFRDQLTLLRMKKEKLERSIQRVENQKQETVDYLKGKGVSSTADLKGNADLEYAARNLQGWAEQAESLKKDVGKFDRAIAAITTMLDEFDRKRINANVAISEEEWIRMQTIVKGLDEELGMNADDIFKDEEMNQLLNKELGSSGTEKKNGG